MERKENTTEETAEMVELEEALIATDLDNFRIHSTKDYEKFTSLIGNRKINQKHVGQLMDSMRKRHLASIAIVNKFGHIIDGQHRYEAVKRLGLPFNFIIMEDYGVEEVHFLNTNNSNWKEIDFIRQYADLYTTGEEQYLPYKQVMDLVERESIHYKVALYMLEGGKVSGTQVVISGNLTFTKEDLGKTEHRMAMLNQCIGIIGTKAKSSAFAQSLVIVMEVRGFNSKHFLKKLPTAKKELLIERVSWITYLKVFQTAYNSRLAIDKQLPIDLEGGQIYKKLLRRVK